MRKENIDKRQRVDLRPAAMALMIESCPAGEIPNADHLDAGILKLKTEFSVVEGINKELKFQLDRLDSRYEQFLAQHRLSTRNEVMMLGQIIRELYVYRQILTVSAASSNYEAERLMDKALPIIMELRGPSSHGEPERASTCPNMTTARNLKCSNGSSKTIAARSNQRSSRDGPAVTPEQE